MIRLFVALKIPEAVNARLASLCGGVPGARWLQAEQMHLTLRFIGDVAEDVVGDVKSELSRVRSSAFDYSINGVGCFGRAKKARVLWVGIAANQELRHFQSKIEVAVQQAGLVPEERKFSPHITLARLKRSKPERVQDWLSANVALRAGPVRADGFTLFSSFLSSAGAIHTPLERFELQTPNLDSVRSTAAK